MAILSTRKKKTQGYKIISASYYDPKPDLLETGKNNNCIFNTYWCKKSSECKAYQQNMCCLKNSLDKNRCPFGEIRRKEGMSPLFQYYDVNLYKFKQDNQKVLNKLFPAHRIIEVGGEYYYMPLIHLNNNVNPISVDLGIVEGHFLPKDKFTIENLIKLIMYRPLYPSGQVIKFYLDTCVPELVLQLKIWYPECYEEIKKKIVNIDSILSKADHKFYYAKVLTLKPGKVLCNKFIGYWDGTNIFLSSSRMRNYTGMKNEERISIIPNEDTLVQVIDEDTVIEDTIFI